MSRTAVVLLSSGLDSTANLYAAKRAGWSLPLALTIDYGQRAAPREIARSQEIARRLDVPHRILKLDFFKDFGTSSLVDQKLEVPTGDEVSIDDPRVSQKTAKSVWVPNRNGILLNIAAGFAETLGANTLIPGFNREEASTFPDNTPEFMQALSQSFSFSTANRVQVHCFTADLDKPEIAARAQSWGVPFDLIWPCYLGNEHPCGRCESCQRDKRAFRSIGLDVAAYFEDAT